ncbi:MAG: hypothetical protein KDC55_03385 [Ignavibacteriae bacterium]|nr:hypothetical protein [Ignavibacteriota bacterium]
MNPEHSKQEVLIALEKLIKSSNGRIAPQDAAAATGYSTQDVEDSLARLMELYKCKVEVDEENARPIFNFDIPFKKRGEKTFQEKLAVAINIFWEVFKKIYKVAIGVILIVYTLIFVIIIMLVASQGGDRDRRNNNSSRMISNIFSAIFHGMRFAAINKHYSTAVDRDNMHYRYYEKPEHKGKKFIQSVYDFVFGPERPEFDPLNDTKEVATYIRDHSDKITSADIINLSGVDYDEADSRLAEYASKFRGSIDITENGTAVADFRDLSVISSKLEGGKVEYYIDEVEPPYEMTGNTSGRNFGIGFMNLFNLLMSIAVIQGAAQIESGLVIFALGWFPLIFSILFFLIPIGRALTHKKKEAERSKNVVRKILVGQIIAANGGPLTMEQVISKINLQNHSIKEVEEVLSKVVLDLRGEIVIAENGTPMYNFDRLKRELAA